MQGARPNPPAPDSIKPRAAGLRLAVARSTSFLSAPGGDPWREFMNGNSNPIIRFLEITLSVIEATLNRTANFSTKYWFVVLPLVAAASLLAVFAIKNYFYFEADLTKFLPKDYATIKSDDYYRQNFNHQDFALVGIEVDPEVYESVWDPRVLRMMEQIILDLKGVTATKTFTSLLTGQEETVTLPIGIDVDDIQSVANLEDIILDEETGALRTGRMNRSIKEDLGISDFQLGLLWFAFFFSYALAQVPSGWLTDRFPRRESVTNGISQSVARLETDMARLLRSST